MGVLCVGEFHDLSLCHWCVCMYVRMYALLRVGEYPDLFLCVEAERRILCADVRVSDCREVFLSVWAEPL